MRRLTDSDSGFTLVELLIYILLAAIVGTIVAGILINSLRVQVQIQDSSAAAQGTFLVADALGTAVRDSTDLSAATLADGSPILRTRSFDPSQESETTFGPDAFICYAFVVDGDALRFRSSPTAIPDPTADELDLWTAIADGVQAINGSTPFFAVLDDGAALRLSLISEIGDGGPQQVTTTIQSLQLPDPTTDLRVSAPCF